MALKLYVAYGIENDQVIALRLQALAAVNGLEVYVPSAETRRFGIDQRSQVELGRSEVVIGVVTTAISEACRQELNAAKEWNKRIMIIAESHLVSWLAPYFPDNLAVIDPTQPALAEQAIVDFLRRSQLEENARKALLALGTLALGLLLFAPQE